LLSGCRAVDAERKRCCPAMQNQRRARVDHDASIAMIAVTAIANLPKRHCASGRLLCKDRGAVSSPYAIVIIEARMISWLWAIFKQEITEQRCMQ
jgi:hypothetical protein